MQAKWLTIVDKTVEFYKTQLGTALHSVYVRGSVAKAEAIDFISDLDTFAITHSEIQIQTETEASFIAAMAIEFPFCTDIEISTNTIDELSQIPANRKRSILDELIKIHSRCVYGENLGKTITDFRIEELPGHAFYLANEVNSSLPKMIEEDKADPAELKSLCTWIMKRVIRSSYDLVMVKEQKFTRDLYLCYEQASQHYPDKEVSLRKALDLCLNPTEYFNEWMPLVSDLSRWIEDEISLIKN